MDFTLPKITIITPSFNQGAYIEQTIQSVLEQVYPNFEYIIIDGGSTDETVEIIKKYDSRIAYWVSEPDAGQTDAINKGFARANGEIINWLNSDDYLEQGCLSKIAASFQNSAVKAITTTVHNFEEEGAEWDELAGTYGTPAAYIAKGFNNQPGTFFRRAVWDRYFPLPQQLRFTMDQYIWFCFWLENTRDAFLHETYTTVFFRRHAGSKTSTSLTDTVFNHLGKVFFNEHHLLFWSFFSAVDASKAAVLSSYFWEGYDYASNRIFFPANLLKDGSETEALYQLYLFQLVKEDFRLGFFDRLKSNIGYLNRAFFSPAEVRQIKKFGLSTLSTQAIKTYRLIYWKVKSAINKQG